MDKDETEITFKRSLSDLSELENELKNELVRLKLRTKKNKPSSFDIVDEFIGPELKEFYQEYDSLQELLKKSRLEKVVTAFVVKTWKDKIDKICM